MQPVQIVGVGMSRFAKQPELGFDQLGHQAILAAVRDAGLETARIEAAYCGTLFGGQGAGQRVLRHLGLTGVPVLNIENACSSGSSALREAWLAVAAGLHEVVLAFGVEKLTDLGGGGIPLKHEDIEAEQGLLMPAVYAMRAQRHMAEYGTTIEQLAQIAVKNHRHAVHNPRAQYRREYTLQEVLSSRPVADPLTLLHCCPTSDGAAAVIVASERVARQLAVDAVTIRASVLRSGRFRNDARDMTTSELTVEAAAEAYERAGLGPEDIDVAEVHDAFTIGELMYYEALGFCGRGEGGRLVESGATAIGGRIPVNPSGGLLSKGHPVGATGLAQVVEVTEQLRGRSGPRQVHGARIGLTHCTGGGVAGFDHIACTVHVLEGNARA